MRWRVLAAAHAESRTFREHKWGIKDSFQVFQLWSFWLHHSPAHMCPYKKTLKYYFHICLKTISKPFHYFFFSVLLLFHYLLAPIYINTCCIPVSSHHPLLPGPSGSHTYCTMKKLTQKNIIIKRTQKHWPKLLSSWFSSENRTECVFAGKKVIFICIKGALPMLVGILGTRKS